MNTRRHAASVLCVAAVAAPAAAEELQGPLGWIQWTCSDQQQQVEVFELPDGPPDDDIIRDGECGGGGGNVPSEDPPEETDSTSPGSAEDCESDPPLYTEYPVSLRRGIKVERAVDLRVRIPGPDFELVRRYASDHSYIPNRRYVGNLWTLQPLSFVRWIGPNRIIMKYSHGGDSSMRFDYKDHPSLAIGKRWMGPANSTIIGEQDQDNQGVAPSGLLRLYNYGEWTRVFYDGSQEQILEGKIKEEYDKFGNHYLYNWSWHESAPSDTIELNYICLKSAPNQSDQKYAVLDFTWDSQGRIQSVHVFRPDPQDPNTFYWTQGVRYRYLDEIANPSPDVSPSTSGDNLVQVEYYESTDETPDLGGSSFEDFNSPPGASAVVPPAELLDPANDIRRRVTQYRYGISSHLEAIFPSAQTEHYQWKTGNAPDDLLELDDDADAIASEGVKVVDLASKRIEYGNNDRVSRQYIQTQCGCSGGASQGKRITYSYYDDESASFPDLVDPDPGDLDEGEQFDDKITRRIVVEEEAQDPDNGQWVPHRTIHYDMMAIEMPYGDGGEETLSENHTRYKTTIEQESGGQGRAWATGYSYFGADYSNAADSLGFEGQVGRKYRPSALDYEASPGSGARPIVTLSSGDGLVELSTYITNVYPSYDGNEPEVRPLRRNKTLSLSTSSAAELPWESPSDLGALVERYTYITETFPGQDNIRRDELVTKVERVRSDAYTLPNDGVFANGEEPSADDVEVTEYEYALSSIGAPAVNDLERITERTIKVERELVSENGPASGDFYKTVETYNSDGTISKVERPDGTNTEYAYSVYHGERLQQKETSDQGSLNPLVTSMAYDRLGRLVTVQKPDGTTTNIWRELREHPDDDQFGTTIERYAEVSLPSDTGGVSEGHGFAGPISITYYDADDRRLGEQAFTASDVQRNAEGNLAPPQQGQTPYTIGEELARSYLERDVAGLVVRRREHHDVDTGGAFYDTTYDYDTLGRVSAETYPTGTVMGYAYDVLDRVIKEKIGTDPDALDVKAEYFYDSGGAAMQGVGNGNLTKVKRYTEDGADPRVTTHDYDFRDRRIETINSEPPHEHVAYDNLGRVVTRELFNNSAVGSDDRVLYEDYAYNQRGLQYRKRRAMAPEDGESSALFLEWHTWYDQVGRPIAQWEPNGPATKTLYDELGRPKKVYTTDRGGDPDPGAADNYDHAKDAAGDIVLEQKSYQYIGAPDAQDTPENGVGQVGLVTTYRRAHDSGATGPLDQAPSSAVVESYTGHYYDLAGRRIRTDEYGTNSGDDVFETGGPPTITQGFPLQSPGDNALSARTVYGVRGLVEREIDPKGVETKYFYDDLNRQVGVVENYVDGEVIRDGTPDWGWKLDAGAAPAASDEDRATIFNYDGSDNLTHRVAAFYDDQASAIDYQVTRYIYGVSAGDPAAPGGGPSTTIESNDLLRRVVYPDDYTPGQDPPPGSAPSVRYWHNRQGEVIATEDQNGTVHEYTRDDLGRITEDTVIAFGQNIDTTTEEIEIVYDGAGRRSRVTSRTQAEIHNDVRFFYNGLWQIDAVRQNPQGPALETNSDYGEVSYDYEQVGVAGGNYSRLETQTYPAYDDTPNPTALNIGYGPADGVDDRISRPAGLDWNGPLIQHNVAYEYAGRSIPVVKTYDYPGVRLDRHNKPSSTASDTASGRYPGLDRHGRVRRQLWIGDDGGAEWDPTSRPALINLQYEYDKVSNVTARYDRRADDRVEHPGRDELYTYDGLHRLTEAPRGVKNHDGGGFTNGTDEGRAWGLDHLGNWSSFIRNLNADEIYEEDQSPANDLVYFRTHNAANEMMGQSIHAPAGQSGVVSSHDAAGNMTLKEVDPTPIDGQPDNTLWTYIYDAWNRIVEVRVSPDGESESIRARYEYNGLHQRVVREADADAKTGLDQKNLYYYDASWRLFEERIDDDWDGASFAADRIVQRIWCIHYIDALIAQQTDTDDDGNPETTPNVPDGDFSDGRALYALLGRKYDVLAMVDLLGRITERVRYSPYGVARNLPFGDANADGVVDQADIDAINAAIGGDLDAAPGSPEWNDYDPDLDLDFNGEITVRDAARAQAVINDGTYTGGLPEGRISMHGATVGYSGYLYDAATDMSLARFRWYDARLGRWMTRDPLQKLLGVPELLIWDEPTNNAEGLTPYISSSSATQNTTTYTRHDDFSNLYEYAISAPTIFVDPHGLVITSPTDWGDKYWDPKVKRWRYKKGVTRGGTKVGGRFTRAPVRGLARRLLQGLSPINKARNVACGAGLAGILGICNWTDPGITDNFVNSCLCRELSRNKALGVACSPIVTSPLKKALGCDDNRTRSPQEEKPDEQLAARCT